MQHRFAYRIVVLLLLALFYRGLTQKYRAYDIDNPWFLSFSYNACHGGPQTDEFAEVRYPNGMDGVHLSGKLAAGAQCLVLNRTGWTPGAVVGLNLTFGLVSFWLWWSFLCQMGYREKWIAAFILLLGVMEPIVSMIEKARYDIFVFFCLSVALWLGAQGLELAAVLVAMLSIEIEPVALVVPGAIVLLLAMRTENRKFLVAKVGVAAGVIVAIYLELHPGAIYEMAHAPHSSQKYLLGGTMAAYFVEHRRHLPELAMLLLGGLLCWSERGKITDRTGQWLAAAMGAMFFLGPHPNPAYAAYAMPFLLWPALEAYDHAKRWRWVPALVFVGILMQYGYLYKVNRHEGFDSRDFTRVREPVADSANALQIPAEQVRICGDYSLWFVHPQNYSACSATKQDSALLGENLYLCFDEPLMKNGLSSTEWVSCSELERVMPLHELSSVDVHGHLLHFYRRDSLRS